MKLTPYTKRRKKEKNQNDAIDINLYDKQFTLLQCPSNPFKRDYKEAYQHPMMKIQVLIIESPCVLINYMLVFE